MADTDKSINALPAASELQDESLLPVWQQDKTMSVTGQQLKEYAAEGGREAAKLITKGTTFTPAVSAAGVLSWTNDGGAQNPAPVDLVAAVLAAMPDADNFFF